MTKKCIFFVSDNIGETHIIFPIIYELINKKDFDIKIIFTNEIVYNQFKKIYYEDLDLNIKSKIFKLKFFFNETSYNKLQRILGKFLNIILNLLFLLKIFINSNVFFIEGSFNTSFGRFLLKINNLIFKKNIIVYLQGLRPYIGVKNRSKFGGFKRNFKLFHLAYTDDSKEIDEINEAGFDKAIPIGFPLKSNYFDDLKKKFTLPNKKNILFLPRAIGDIHLKEEEAKNYLLVIKKIMRKKFPNHKLVVHLHIKERTNFFKNFIKENNFENTLITDGNILKEMVNADFVICNLTSAIYLAYALNIPATEFYTRTEDIIKWYPELNGMTVYNFVGFQSLTTFKSFENYIDHLDLERFKYDLNINLNSLNILKLIDAILEK